MKKIINVCIIVLMILMSTACNKKELKIKEIYNIDKIYVIDEAEVNTTPININHKKDKSLHYQV